MAQSGVTNMFGVTPVAQQVMSVFQMVPQTATTVACLFSPVGSEIIFEDFSYQGLPQYV